MARVTDVFISGTMGNMVLYRRMGKNCARLKREGIQQTMATKIRSENFGIASRAAKYLRKGLQPAIPVPTDRAMQSRFSGAIAKWLRLTNAETLPACDIIPYVSSIQFTNGDDFSDRFNIPVTVSSPEKNMITVCVDAFVPVKKVVAPAGTLTLELVIAVAGCVLRTGMPSGSRVQRIQVPYNNDTIASQVLKFPVEIPAGSLTVTAAWLQYFVLKNNRISRCENTDFMPAGVLNASYKGY